MGDDEFRVVLPKPAALTVAEMLAEREELIAERDRLRAVVDAVVFFRLRHDHFEEADLSPEVEAARLEAAVRAWDRVTALLDESEDMGDGGTEGDHGRGDDRDRVADPLRAADGDLSQADGSVAPATPVGIERERAVLADPELRASLERGMTQAAAGQVVGHGSFVQYADETMVESSEGSPGSHVVAAVPEPSSDGRDVGTGNPGVPPPERAQCRWCRQPIVFLPVSEPGDTEGTWVHEGPQLGHGSSWQRACEPDMQSMLAEPDPNLWHCRCGKFYNLGYAICPHCETPREEVGDG